LNHMPHIDSEEYGAFKKKNWIAKYLTNQSASQI